MTFKEKHMLLVRFRCRLSVHDAGWIDYLRNLLNALIDALDAIILAFRETFAFLLGLFFGPIAIILRPLVLPCRRMHAYFSVWLWSKTKPGYRWDKMAEYMESWDAMAKEKT